MLCLPCLSRARAARLTRRVGVCTAALLATLVASAPGAPRPGARPSDASCEKRVTFALVDARTNGCLTKVSSSPNTWESTDPVSLDGIPLQALPGTKLVLRAPTEAAPGGSVAVTTRITLAGATLFEGGFDYNLPAGGAGDQKMLASISPPRGASVKGFALDGRASIELGREKAGEQQGYARFELIVKLPDVFRNGPEQKAGGLTGTVAVRADAGGIHADTLKIEVANAYIGQVLLKDVCLSYVAAGSTAKPCAPPKFGATQILTCENKGAERWDGSALITLPTADKPEVGVFAGTANGQFAYAGAQVSHLGSSAQLAPGVYLDKVGIAICLNPPPLKIKGAVGIRFGPEFNGSPAAYLDGSVQYTDSRPWVLEADGALKLFGKDAAKGYFTYRSDGAIDFGFDVSWSFYGLLDVSAGVQGWYQPPGTYTHLALNLRNPEDAARLHRFLLCALPIALLCPEGRQAALAGYEAIPREVVYEHVRTAKFDVFGHGRVCAAGVLCVGGEVAASSVGVAGCVEFTVFGHPEVDKHGRTWPWEWEWRWVEDKIRAGAGYRWGSGGNVDVMGSSCDVGAYRATKSAVISASGARRVRLGPAPAVALRVTGAGGAPKIAITGPGGRRILADQAGRLRHDDYYYVEDAADDTTSVLISDPAPGTWTIQPLAGSPRVLAVSQAPVEAEPTAVGNVIGHGSDRALAYAVESGPHQRITFWERGADYEQELGPASGRPCLQGRPILGTPPPSGFRGRPQARCGVIAFAPAPGPAGERRIVAVVSDHGEPVRELAVASYRTPGEPLPARPRKLRIARRGSTATITWGRSRGAYDYDVDVYLSDGARLLDVAGSHERRVVLHDVPRNLGMRVVVAGVRSDAVPGPAASMRSGPVHSR
jgi:hypothetical protein